jgi:hypothetical protein
MAKEQAENSEMAADTAAERFRTHLRARLTEMRENARRIGASSSYIESLDRSTDVVLTAITAARPARGAETDVAVPMVQQTRQARKKTAPRDA